MNTCSINLLLIPEKLNTDTAKKIAAERLELMRLYLDALNLRMKLASPDNFKISKPFIEKDLHIN